MSTPNTAVRENTTLAARINAHKLFDSFSLEERAEHIGYIYRDRSSEDSSNKKPCPANHLEFLRLRNDLMTMTHSYIIGSIDLEADDANCKKRGGLSYIVSPTNSKTRFTLTAENNADIVLAVDAAIRKFDGKSSSVLTYVLQQLGYLLADRNAKNSSAFTANPKKSDSSMPRVKSSITKKQHDAIDSSIERYIAFHAASKLTTADVDIIADNFCNAQAEEFDDEKMYQIKYHIVELINSKYNTCSLDYVIDPENEVRFSDTVVDLSPSFTQRIEDDICGVDFCIENGYEHNPLIAISRLKDANWAALNDVISGSEKNQLVKKRMLSYLLVRTFANLHKLAFETDGNYFDAEFVSTCLKAVHNFCNFDLEFAQNIVDLCANLGYTAHMNELTELFALSAPRLSTIKKKLESELIDHGVAGLVQLERVKH